MKQKQVSYRKRRDLMLKNFSASKCVNILAEVIIHSGVGAVCVSGIPCEVRKEKLISFVVWSHMCDTGYEEMELKRHYDHSNLQYHYTKLSMQVLYALTHIFEHKIQSLIQRIIRKTRCSVN